MHRDQLPIPEPCHADWEAMTGDAGRRFCGSCTKHVHDLSAMTAPEAGALLANEQDLCIRYSVAADGRILHAPTRKSRLLAIALALFGTTPAFASGAIAQPPPTPDEPTLMERVLRRAQEAIGYVPETVVSAEPVEIRMGDFAPEPPPPPPPPIRMLGRPVMPPPVIQLPKPTIPTPRPGETVIPEVEQALREQR